PNAAPAAPPPASAPLPAGPASAARVGAGPDINSVPWDLVAPVREYFTPEQTPEQAPAQAEP
ncbi:MAG: glycosyltransferase, partial [Chloroflexota bacterium]